LNGGTVSSEYDWREIPDISYVSVDNIAGMVGQPEQKRRGQLVIDVDMTERK
jgi:hypothetical protein